MNRSLSAFLCASLFAISLAAFAQEEAIQGPGSEYAVPPSPESPSGEVQKDHPTAVIDEGGSLQMVTPGTTASEAPPAGTDPSGSELKGAELPQAPQSSESAPQQPPSPTQPPAVDSATMMQQQSLLKKGHQKRKQLAENGQHQTDQNKRQQQSQIQRQDPQQQKH